MIIDAHVHLIGVNGAKGSFVSKRMSSGIVFYGLSRLLGLRGISRDELDAAYRSRLVEWVHGSDLDAACLLGLDAIYDNQGKLDQARTHVYVSNDYVLDVAAESDELLPICSVNPMRRDAIDELERVVEAGSVAIKWLPNSQDFDPANPDFTPFYEKMAALGVPLLTHTSFEHTIPPVNQLWGKPGRLRLPLELGVRVIAAHCAGAGTAHFFEEDFGDWHDMLSEFPNLYGDISAMASISRFQYLSKVLASELARSRVIYGSDFPVPISPVVFAPRLGLKAVRDLNALDNPLQKNFETMRAMGVDDSILHRAHKVLRVSDFC